MITIIRDTLSRIAVVLLASMVGSIAGVQANTPEFSPVSHQHAEVQASSAITSRIPKGALPTVLNSISPGLPAAYDWQPLAGADDQPGQAYQAANADQQQGYRLVDGALELSLGDQYQHKHLLRFRLSGFGRAGDLQPVGAIEKTEFPNDNQLRQHYAGELEEWFVNSPVGLEHGFTLNQPPAGSDSQSVVVLALGVSGDLIPQVDADALGVSFLNSQGETLLGYRGLVAYDGTGQHLPVTMQQADSQIHLRVDVSGARYPVTVDPLFQTEIKLDAGSTKESYAYFGWSVAVDGNWMAVGAPYEDSGGLRDSGAVYLFRRSGLSWSLFTRKTADSLEASALFGMAVALSGNTLAVGAEYKDKGALTDAGAVYVFDYGRYCGFPVTYSCWDQRAELGAGTTYDDASDHFGISVDIEGDTLVVGAHQDEATGKSAINNTGVVYVFNRSAGSWNSGTQLVPVGSAAGDNVGYSVAISGSSIAFGARLDDAAGVSAGAVYIYTGAGSSWAAEYKVLGVAAGDQLGYSVDIDGKRMIAGAPYADPNALSLAGEAYIYYRHWNKQFSAYEWLKLTTLEPLQADNVNKDAELNDLFGFNVAIDLDSGGEGTGYALVSAPYNDDNDDQSGSAYLYADNGSGGSWGQIKKLTAHDAAGSDYYGKSVALDAKTAVIGAHYEDDKFINNGAAYVVGTQADSYLTLDLDRHAVLTSETVDASVQLVVGGVSPPDTALSGISIRLLVCNESDVACEDPLKTTTANTDDTGTADFFAFWIPRTAGYYRLVARVYSPATLPDYWEMPVGVGDIIVVQANAGAAVIIEGANVDPANNGEPSHNKTANRIYETLLQRGFTDDRIFYFNQQVGDPDRPGVDARADIAELDSWLLNDTHSLQNYLKDNPGPLHFFMVSHGDRHPTNGSGRFILNPGDGVTPEEIGSQDINGILNTLQALPGMANWPVAITLASCYSGAHIPDVSSLMGRGRVVVTSTMDDQQGYKGPLDSLDRIRGGSFFADEFLQELKQDLSYKQAFKNAAASTEAYTQQDDAVDSLAGQYIDNAMQNPLLDDNGDTAGTNNLSDTPGADGSIARDVYLGVGVWQPETKYIVAETQYLPAPDAINLGLFDLRENIDAVDVVIRPPGTTLLDDLDTEQSEADYIHESMTRFGNTNTFTLPFEFQKPGKWEIWYRPIINGKYVAVRHAVVYVSDGDFVNGPGAFNLLKPVNSAAHAKTRQLFDWEQSLDLSSGGNGPDAVTYKLLIASSNAATDGVLDAPLFSQDEIPSSLYYLGDRVLEDATTYYWQVIAIDSFGHQTPSDIWSFTTDDTNLVGGPLVGNILDSSTALGVDSALVQVNPSAAYSQEGGYFIVTDGIAGPNEATASKASYLNKTVGVVLSYNPSVSTEENFSLQQDAPDTDGDGLSDSFETSIGTNPNEIDSDFDGLNDDVEVGYDGNVGAYDPFHPTTNATGTDLDANSADTDQDGLTDDEEVNNSSDPLDDQSWPNYADGDLNGDGNVNAGDYLIANRIVLDLLMATPTHLAHGDMYPATPDGVINLSDLLLIQQAVIAP